MLTLCVRPCRKDIELSPYGLPLPRLLSSKAQRLCSSDPEMQSSRVVSRRLRPSHPAARFIPPTRDHCVACGVPWRSNTEAETQVPGIPPDAAAPRGDCASAARSPSTDSEVASSGVGDHLRRPRSALGCSAPAPMRTAGRAAAGAQIITVGADRVLQRSPKKHNLAVKPRSLTEFSEFTKVL